jgi:hypothetical protein
MPQREKYEWEFFCELSLTLSRADLLQIIIIIIISRERGGLSLYYRDKKKSYPRACGQYSSALGVVFSGHETAVLYCTTLFGDECSGRPFRVLW